MFHKKVLALLTQPQHYFSLCYRCLQSGGVRGNNKRVLSNKVPKFKIYSVDSNGIRSHFEVTKTSLYHELGLTVRDLRFQHVNMIAVRNKKIILRFQNLKAIICTDAVLLVDPPFHNDSGSKSEISTFWNELPSLITGSSLYTSNLPLEYRVLEAVFAYNISSLTATLSQLEPNIQKLLTTLTDPTQFGVDRSLVHILLENSTRLNAFATIIREFCATLEELLDIDDDIRDLCITVGEGENRSMYDAFIFSPFSNNKNRSITKTQDSPSKQVETQREIHHKFRINLQDEMETLIDTFLRSGEEIGNKVAELKEAIDNSNTAILINLDSHRNLLLRLELQLTMGMFSCTLFGMFGMAFGMNLDSSFEENPLAFWVVSGVMFAGAGLSWRLMLRRLRDAPLHGTSSANKIKESEFSSSCSTANKGDANIVKHDEPQLKDNATQFYLKNTLHNNDISNPRMKPLGSSGIFSQYEERNKRNIRFLHTLPFAL